MRDQDQKQDQTTTTGTTTNHSFNVAPALLQNKVEDRGEFILIRRNYGSEQPQIWSTGDEEFTQQLLRQVSSEVQPA